MHPALALARRKLKTLRAEFEQAVSIEREVVPAIVAQGTPTALVARSALRATAVEGVYTGIEGVLREVLSAVDGGVFSVSENWHAQLLAQAVEPNLDAGRSAILSEEAHAALDRLRAFRHVERDVYRHLLRAKDVDENFDLLLSIFPRFEQELGAFLDEYGLDGTPRPDPDDASPSR